VLLPITIDWNFAGFACILFDENHEISDLLSISRDFVTVAKEVREYYRLRNYTSHSFFNKKRNIIDKDIEKHRVKYSPLWYIFINIQHFINTLPYSNTLFSV
jgi:hypothetical protein